MKRIIVFLLVVTLLVLSLASCGGNKTNDTDNTTGNTENGNTEGNAQDGNVDGTAKNGRSIIDDFSNGMNDFGNRMVN